MKKIAISIINFNGTKSTLACLDSLEKIIQKKFQVYVRVIDNNSEEPFKCDVKKYPSLNISLYLSDKNLGFSGGHNKGIEFAHKIHADYILILNNDTTVDKNLVQNMFDAIEDKKCAAVVPKIYFTPGLEFHKSRYSKNELGKVIWYAGGKLDWNNLIGYHDGVDSVDIGQFNTMSETEFATGACVMIPMEIFKKISGFDEKYFLYYEDNDLCMNLKKYGKIFYVPNALLWHDNAGSTGGSGSTLQDYFISRNRMLFGMKYAPLRTKVALVRESIRIIFSGRKWQKKGVQDFYLRKFGKGSYPISD
jgi:GT2 family glycosyltransferase